MATPPALQNIVDLFADAPCELRLEALLEYSRGLPALPPRLKDNRQAMEQVVECQTPFFLASEVGEDRRMRLWFDAPPEAPTTRGFAGILASGLNGATPEEVLETPDDFYDAMGLSEIISSLRLRGMAAILFRLKRQVRTALEAERA
ncbi:MAG TPA: SufE family protein [Actinomycetota bacterium]|nr:SufE family protein [Actinomycetota bacterium]